MTTAKKPRRMAREVEPGSGPQAGCAEAGARRSTKQDMVLALLQAEGGSPLSVIVEATGWLPHTARAALTGLRKKGHAIIRSKVDGETRYAIEPEVAVQ